MLMLPLLVSAVAKPSPIEFVPVVQEAAAPGPAVTEPEPQVRPQTLVAEARYPADALDAGAQGRVVARLAVGARGTVTDCRIVTGTGFKPLDEESCAILRSGDLRFAPARDARGRAVASRYVANVEWKLPAAGPVLPFAGGSSLIRYTLAPDGRTTGCTVAVSGSVPQLPGGPCAKDNLPYEEVAASWRAGNAQAPVTIVRREEFVIDGVPAAPPLPLPPGYRVLATHRYDLEMSPGGWIVDCSPAAGETASTAFGPCPTRVRYARPPAGADDTAWVTMTVNLATDRALPAAGQFVSPQPMFVPQVNAPPRLQPAPPAPPFQSPRPAPPPPVAPALPPHPGLARPTQPIEPGSWITDDDYPGQALRNGDAGAVLFEIAVDRTGMPTMCTILGSSTTSLIEDLACDLLMARARFHPALDAAGRPIAAVFRSRVTFRIPED